MSHHIAIIGSGIIGSALAYELSQRNISGVHVFDVDKEGTLSSTERNAGGVRHLWLNPINAELSRISINFFEQFQKEVGFQQKGYLWLYSPETESLGERVFSLSQSRGLNYERLDPREIQSRYPFIDKTDDISFAIFGKKDGILNSNALKTFLQSNAKGVTFHDRVNVVRIEEESSRARLFISRFASQEDAQSWLSRPVDLTPTEEITFDKVVVCAGAWASYLLAGNKIRAVTKPVRRQIAIFSGEGIDLAPYGMIVDTSKVYFHAEGGNILAGLVLKDEPEGYNFAFDNDFFEEHIWPALYNRSSHFERLKLITGWSGLYSYSPDITGILGRIPGFQNIFESHSYTGHGVMHSIGAAKAMADLLTQGKFQSLDATALSRDRFARGELLEERLHI